LSGRSRWGWRVQGPLIASLLAVFALAFVVCRFFLLTFTVALAASLILSGPHRRLTRRLGGRRGLAAALLLSMCVITLVLPVVAYGALFARQSAAFVEWLAPRLTPEAAERFWTETLPARNPTLMWWADRLLGGAGIRGGSEMVAGLGSRLRSFAQAAFFEGLAALVDTAIFLMIVFFLLRDEAELRAAIRGVSPFTRGQETEALYHMAQTVKAVFLSLVLVPVVQGVVALLGFWALGLPAPVLWSALVIFAALIPILGTPLVWVPAGLYLIATGATGRGIGVLIYGAVAIASVDNLVKPIILRETARVHTMLGFLFVLGGVYAFGAKGVIAGPVILSLAISAYRIYRYDVLRWREPELPAPGVATD
jgi:predicted PurR-regulated permease PerM